MIVNLLSEKLRPLALAVLAGGDGRSALECRLRELAVVEVDIVQEGLFQVLAAGEAVALQDLLDPAVEALEHAVGLRVHRRRKAVLVL